MVRHYDGNNFDEIIKSRVLVDFYADWCGPCKMLGPELEKIDGIDIVKVNVDDNQELAREYGVMSIPCVILFDKSIKSSYSSISCFLFVNPYFKLFSSTILIISFKFPLPLLNIISLASFMPTR